MLFDFVFLWDARRYTYYSLILYLPFPKMMCFCWLARFVFFFSFYVLEAHGASEEIWSANVCTTAVRLKQASEKYNYGGCMTRIHRHRRSSVSFKKTGIESTTEHFVIGKRSDKRPTIVHCFTLHYNRIYFLWDFRIKKHVMFARLRLPHLFDHYILVS